MELELDTPDDPKKALWAAVAAGDAVRAMGAWRLLEASGERPDLEPPLARELAELLEARGHFLDAARAYRLAAEGDLEAPEAQDSALRAACLLLGPADRPEPGRQLLRFSVERWPAHPGRARAASLLDRLERGEQVPARELLPHLDMAQVEAHLPAWETARQAHQLGPLPGPDEAAESPLGQRLGRLAEAIQQRTGRVGSTRFRRLARLHQGLLLLALAAFAWGWLQGDVLPPRDALVPEVLRPPEQTPIEDPEPFTFDRSIYRYHVTPLHDYDLAGLVVAKRDHLSFWTEVNAYEDAFPADLCVVWGSNLARGTYLHPSVQFEIHGRVCYGRGSCQARIRNEELSNNHLFVQDDRLLGVLSSIEPGDQIRIRGKLVDIRATRLERALRGEDPAAFQWKSSTSRGDHGMGACETILADDVHVLATGNRAARLAGGLGLWLLVPLLVLAGLRYLLLPVGIRAERRASGLD
jgi:hypothetical protein